MKLGTASRDTLALSRRKIRGVGSYQLEALMKHLGYEVSNAHRVIGRLLSYVAAVSEVK